MFKKFASIIVLTALIFTTACGGGNSGGISTSDSNNGDTQEKTVTLRLGHITGDKDAWHIGALKFAELVKEKSGGTVEVEVYASSTLGNDRDLIEGMQLGSVDFALVAGVLSNFHEPFSILEVPYLFRDQEHLEKVLYGEIGNKLRADLLENASIRGLDFWVRGPRQLTSNKKVEAIEDLKSVKIRVPEIPASIEAWSAMGASPTPMAFGEVYSSLQTGIINAQENPLAFISSNKMQEVQDYLVLTNHVYGYVLLAMSDITYNKLSESQRQAVEEAAKEATQFENALVAEQEEKLLQSLQEEGMEVIEVDTSSFAEKVKPVQEKFAAQYGQELYDSIISVK